MDAAIVDGAVGPSVAAADTTVSSATTAALHELTPGFAFAGTRAATRQAQRRRRQDPATAELLRAVDRVRQRRQRALGGQGGDRR